MLKKITLGTVLNLNLLSKLQRFTWPFCGKLDFGFLLLLFIFFFFEKAVFGKLSFRMLTRYVFICICNPKECTVSICDHMFLIDFKHKMASLKKEGGGLDRFAAS